MRERLGPALGVATLALLPAWDAVGALPGHAQNLSAWGWMIGATALIAGAIDAGGSLSGLWRLLAGTLLALMLCPLLIDSAMFILDAVRDVLARTAGSHYASARTGLVIAAGVAAVGLAWWVHRSGLAALRDRLWSFLSLLAPLPLVVALSTAWSMNGSARVVSDAPVERRLVVLVFDELDGVEVARSPARLPNFHRLEATGLSAHEMYPPANYTAESLPAMLSGDDYDAATYTGRDVHVRLADRTDWSRLSDRHTLLSRSASRKAVIGWHLPYCSAFPGLDSCWDDSAFRAPGEFVPLPEWLAGSDRLVRTWTSLRLAQHRSNVADYSAELFVSPPQFRLRRIGRIFAEQRRELLQALAGRRFELVFGHLACPHPPGLEPSLPEPMDRAYTRNLAACDELLGEVLRMLRAAGGKWQIVVTSDHWFRYRDWLESGQPESTPATRRKVPFYLLTDEGPGVAWSTQTLTNSRVLPKLAAMAEQGTLDYPGARRAIDAFGDARTLLRRF